MTSVLSSLFSRDPKGAFPYELPSSHFYSVNGIAVGKSFKKVQLSFVSFCAERTFDLIDYIGGSSAANLIKFSK